MKRTVLAALAVLALAGGATACQGNDSACHAAYQHDYFNRGTPYDMGETAYCKGWNKNDLPRPTAG